jgi:hypothetical protein
MTTPRLARDKSIPHLLLSFLALLLRAAGSVENYSIASPQSNRGDEISHVFLICSFYFAFEDIVYVKKNRFRETLDSLHI